MNATMSVSPSWHAGDSATAYHRVSAARRWETQRLVEYDMGEGSGWVVQFEDFASPREAADIIQLVRRQARIDAQVAVHRQRQVTFLSQRQASESLALHRVLTKLEHLTGVSRRYYERLQALDYGPGQFYHRHHDYEAGGGPANPRVMTALLYLNGNFSDGGTRFTDVGRRASATNGPRAASPRAASPRAAMLIQPRRGRLVLWSNVMNHAPHKGEPWLFHQALPPRGGSKVCLNIFITLRGPPNCNFLCGV